MAIDYLRRTRKLQRRSSFVYVFLVSLVLCLHVASASTTSEDVDPHPLRQADTASPRDTLRSFLTNVDVVITDSKQGIYNWRTTRAYLRAIATLDLSTTPHSDSHEIRTGRVLMLKEILDRIELPPDDEIPGAAEVAAGTVTQWTIPNTSIAISRIEDGLRAGMFLFSADTVQRLHRLYAQAKHLPYKSDVSEGIYEGWLSNVTSGAAPEWEANNRLRPVDTSNPRSTLDGFLDSVSRAYALDTEIDAALTAEPPTMTTDEAREAEITAVNLLRRAAHTFDLSEVPEVLRDNIGIETALQLKEIIDRMYLPMADSVPNAQMIVAAKKAAKEVSSGETGAVRWRYPNTEIEIIEMTEGERKGQFLFSAATVRHIGEYYDKIRDIPYRKGPRNIDWKAPDVSAGFYEDYISTPGYLVSRANLLGKFVDDLPARLKVRYGGQALWQWIALILIVLTVFIAFYVIYVVFRGIAKRVGAPLRMWLMVLVPIIMAVIAGVAIDFIDDNVNITGDVLATVTTSGRVIIIALTAGVVLRLFNAGAETLVALPAIRAESIDASLLRLSARLVGLLIAAWIFIANVSALGIDVVPLLAGLGVGGLAFALAARPTLENVIGSLMIFADKPYQVGQRIKVLGYDGEVESIGLRSTKIRLLSGHQSSIPNEKMATAEIENIGRRPYIRRVFNVTVSRDTPLEKVIRAEEILKDILAVPEARHPESAGLVGVSVDTLSKNDEPEKQLHPNEAIHHPDFPPRVYFNDFNAYSLNILVIYWFHPPEYWNFLEHTRWVNLQIMERFKAEGIDLAYPTQTLHLEGDDKRLVSRS